MRNDPAGNLYLGPWEPLLGTLGTFTWEPLLGNLGTFTWNLGTLGEWVLELLRSAPKPLLWLKTPKHSAVGELYVYTNSGPSLRAGEMNSGHTLSPTRGDVGGWHAP